MRDWILAHHALLWWLGAASLVLFIGTLIAVPILVVRIPQDYFAREAAPAPRWSDLHPVLRAILVVAKNTVGLALILVGAAMLVLPGQGALTILAGLLLTDFPRKHRLERWIVSRDPALRAINWLRERKRRPPLFVE